MTPPKPASLGMLNAWVERGDTREERAARLATVPDNLRQAVKAHVQAYFRIRAAKAMREIRDEDQRRQSRVPGGREDGAE